MCRMISYRRLRISIESDKSQENGVFSNIKNCTIKKSLLGDPGKYNCQDWAQVERERMIWQKESRFRESIECWNKLNEIEIEPPKTPFIPYKFYVGGGNNSMVVRTVFKRRWWWSKAEHMDDPNVNVLWTQLLHKDFMDTIPSLVNGVELTSRTTVEEAQKVVKKMPPPVKRKMKYESDSDSDSEDEEDDDEYEDDEDEIVYPKRSHNHVDNHIHISNKKALYMNMRLYYQQQGWDVFEILPLTYHIQDGTHDPEYHKFLKVYKELARKTDKEKGQEKDEATVHNVWITKPGENTNRGRFINVFKDVNAIGEEVNTKYINQHGQRRSYILQKYIERPFLIHRRKFDIRTYSLITCVNQNVLGFWYKDGYLRTTTREYNLKSLNRMIHLTNDAVQKKADDYGKFESGNKLSYAEFQKYIDNNHPDVKCDVQNDILPQIKDINRK
mmetsp:Transcript_21579/g.24433  ORF Transcript_21579/g.24433 Transcript_21579/m.24433 type:complete len:443 (-) Transcript_21579:953-2281(-)